NRPRNQSFRCGLSRMGALRVGDFRGKRLTIGPNSAIREILFFPDRNRLFKRIDDPTTRVKSWPPVRRSDHDADAGFANFETPEAVNYGDIANAVGRDGLLGKSLELFQGHFFVGLVVEIEGSATASIVAHHTIKDDGRAILGVFDPIKDGLSVNPLAHAEHLH